MRRFEWSPGLLDVGRVLEAVYAFEQRDHYAWLEGIGAAMGPALTGADGVVLSMHRIDPAGREHIAVVPRAFEMVPHALAGAAGAAFGQAIAALPMVGFGHDMLRDGHVGPLPALVAGGALPTLPADLFHVWGAGDDGVSVSITALLSQRGALSTAARTSWTQLTAHLGAAIRLRVGGLPAPGAVLSAGGKVLDAHGAASGQESRAALRLAAHAVDRVRGRKVKDPVEALELWRVLASGRWTIADQFDTDGRRFVVAYENVPMPHIAERLLSLREQQVACFAALGYTNKHIGYALELAPSTVATHLRRAITKLGAGSRAGLARRLFDETSTR